MLKVHEHFMFGGEFELLKFRSEISYKNFIYEGSFSYLDKTHSGENLQWDETKLHDYNNFKKFRIESDSALDYYDKNSHIYIDYNKDWKLEIGQRLNSYTVLHKYFEYNGYPNILLISDCDEISIEIDAEKIYNINDNYFRMGMDWRIGDPRFKYSSLWPGTMIIKGENNIKNFLTNVNSPLLVHKTRTLERIQYINGYHFTYFGSKKEFKEKCKRIAERNAKRVFLSSIIGPWLLQNNIDPMLRFKLKVKKIKSEKFLMKLQNSDWD